MNEIGLTTGHSALAVVLTGHCVMPESVICHLFNQDQSIEHVPSYPARPRFCQAGIFAWAHAKPDGFLSAAGD
jgi:hypothetical protein